MHVLFDESKSLVGDDAEDYDFELGLARKDVLPTQEESKNSQERSGTECDSKTEGQGSEQTGKTTAEPCLEQNNTNRPETRAETIS